MLRAAAIVCFLITLAACGGEEPSRPVALPPVIVDPSGSAKPTPNQVPSLAPVVSEESPAGAEAFAKFWVDTVNLAYRSLDSSALRALSDASCLTCQNYINSLDLAKAEGKTYEDGAIVVVSSTAAPLEDSRAVVLVDYRVPALRVFDRQGALLKTVPGRDKSTLQFELEHRGESWVALQVAQL